MMAHASHRNNTRPTTPAQKRTDNRRIATYTLADIARIIDQPEEHIRSWVSQSSLLQPETHAGVEYWQIRQIEWLEFVRDLIRDEGLTETQALATLQRAQSLVPPAPHIRSLSRHRSTAIFFELDTLFDQMNSAANTHSNQFMANLSRALHLLAQELHLDAINCSWQEGTTPPDFLSHGAVPKQTAKLLEMAETECRKSGKVRHHCQKRSGTVIVLPIIEQDIAIGTLSLVRTQDRRFSEQEVDLLERCATRFSHSLHVHALHDRATRQESFWKNILDKLTIGITIRNTEGTLTYYNRAALNYASNRTEIAAQQDTDPSITPIWLTHYIEGNRQLEKDDHPSQQILRSEQSLPPTPIEILVSNNEEEETRKSVVVTGIPVFDENDALSGCVVTLTDITAMTQEIRDRINTKQHALKNTLSVQYLHGDLALKQIDTMLKDKSVSIQSLQSIQKILQSVVSSLRSCTSDMNDQRIFLDADTRVGRRRVSLISIVENLVDAYRNHENRPRIVVNKDAGDQILEGVWSQRAVEDVITNLLDNAGKYSPVDSQITIKLGVVRNDENRRFACFRIIDQGDGIDPEDAPHVFKQEFRSQRHEDPNSPKYQSGTGYGLYSARKSVQEHGGELKFISAGKGMGTTFILTLPLLED